MKITITIKAIMTMLETLALMRLAKMALKRPLSFSGSCGEVVGGTQEVVVLLFEVEGISVVELLEVLVEVSSEARQ